MQYGPAGPGVPPSLGSLLLHDLMTTPGLDNSAGEDMHLSLHGLAHGEIATGHEGDANRPVGDPDLGHMSDAGHVGPPLGTDQHSDHIGGHLDLDIPMVDVHH
jgi:hypothetical protein